MPTRACSRRAVRALDVADFGQNADRGTNRAFSRILEGVRETEIGENAIAHEFGDEAAEPADRAGGGVLIAPDQASQAVPDRPRPTAPWSRPYRRTAP